MATLIRNSRENAIEYPVNECVGGLLEEVLSVLEDCDQLVEFQVNTLVKATVKHPKITPNKVNIKRYGQYQDYKEDSEGKKIYQYAGIGWHTVEASAQSIIELIKLGYCIRYGIKEGGNTKNDYVGTRFLAFDVDVNPLSIEDLLTQLKGLNITPFAVYYSPSAKPSEGEYQSRLVLQLDQFVTGEYDKLSALCKALTEVIPGSAKIYDPGRYFNGTLLPDLVYSDLNAKVTLQDLYSRYIPDYQESDLPDNEEIEVKNISNASKAQLILKLIEEKVWLPIYKDSDSFTAALQFFFEGWELELKRVSDPVMEWQYQCSNPFSESNKTKSSMTICYSSEECKPPYFIDGSSYEITGSIVDWFYYRFHNWNANIQSLDSSNDFETWSIWALKVLVDFGVWLEQADLALFGKAVYFQMFLIKNGLKYDELKQRFLSDRYNQNSLGTADFDCMVGAYRSKDMKSSTQYLFEVYQFLGKRFSYHPIKNYFYELEKKYSKNIPDINIKNLGQLIFNKPDQIYSEMVLKWLLAAVSRIFEPGIKFDTVLVLQGKQGIYKSTFFETVAVNPDWFTDNVGHDQNSQNEMMICNSNWIIEFSELATTQGKREVGTMRANISRRLDKFKKPYGRNIEEFLRAFVFGATVNEHEFLHDQEGNRRYWVISNIEKINIEWLRENLDAIWYLVFQLYKEKTEKLYFDNEQQQQITELNSDYTVQSKFDDVLLLLESVAEITISDILNRFYQIGFAQQSKPMQMELSSILRKGGWQKKQKMINKNKTIYWLNPNPIKLENNL